MERGLIIDFEGSISQGIREIGFIQLVDYKIQNAGEITVKKEERGFIMSELFNDRCDFFVSHNLSTEKNLIKTIMPYPSTLKEKKYRWGPWLDTCYIYKTLYPNILKYDLKNLALTFSNNHEIDKLANLYCPIGKRTFHHSLYDAICTHLLIKRLSEKLDLKKFLKSF